MKTRAEREGARLARPCLLRPSVDGARSRLSTDMCAVPVTRDVEPGHAQPAATAMIGFVVAVLTTAPASTVLAYRTLATEAELDLPMRRESTRVQVTLHAPAGDEGVPGVSEVEAALIPAASAWRLPCLDFEAIVAGPSSHAPDPNDGITTISIVRSGWLARGYAAEQAANTERARKNLLAEVNAVGGSWI